MATADKKMSSRFGFYLMIGVISALLAACSSPASKSTQEAVKTADGVATVEDFEGDGMDIPLDGTSLEAFDASLARVKKHTSETNYTTLVNAIDFLLFYDLTVKQNKEKLAAGLNGLTGNEVVAKVPWSKPRPGNGEADEETAEEVIIDT